MKQFSILITLLVMSSLALSGEVQEGLKVKGDYKTLEILIEAVDDNAANLTTESVERTVKLKLLSNGIKSITEKQSNYDLQPHYLYVRVNILGDGNTYAIRLCLEKISGFYGVDRRVTGLVFVPEQGSYDCFGTSGGDSEFILNHLGRRVEKFIIDYLESNME